MGIFEAIGADQEVVPGHQIHDSEEGGAGNITRQTLNDARLQVDDHSVAKTLSHEGDSLIVRGDVRTFAEMGQDLDVSRKMLERITRNPFRQRTD